MVMFYNLFFKGVMFMGFTGKNIRKRRSCVMADPGFWCALPYPCGTPRANGHVIGHFQLREDMP